MDGSRAVSVAASAPDPADHGALGVGFAGAGDAAGSDTIKRRAPIACRR
ncbi:hypothetical protein FZEAL_4355, partial [Fusarium zealandicum]